MLNSKAKQQHLFLVLSHFNDICGSNCYKIVETDLAQQSGKVMKTELKNETIVSCLKIFFRKGSYTVMSISL